MSQNGRSRDLGLLVLRLGLGAMLMTHGWGKVVKVFSGDFSFSDPLGLGPSPSLVLAATAEFLFALLVALGVRVRWSAIPPALTMATAAFVVHADDPFTRKEKALLFLLGFVVLSLTGGGRYGLDSWLARKKPPPRRPD